MAKEGSTTDDVTADTRKSTAINRNRLTPFLVRTFYKIGGRFDTDAYTYQREIPRSLPSISKDGNKSNKNFQSEIAPKTGKKFFIGIYL